MTAGPTLHYSHRNVHIYWAMTIAVFTAVCFFWAKIVTGSLFGFEFRQPWSLGQILLNPISIFEYPAQILVLGLLMGTIAGAATLTSQLLSFKYAIPMILAVLLIAELPGFALCLLISCIAVASRPLRFRSRYVSIVLCTAPMVIYWGLTGYIDSPESLAWAVSFAPWLLAWLTLLVQSAVVIIIGHFTRYRPGVIWSTSAALFFTALGIFQSEVNFAELDYQLYVAKNNPLQLSAFHDKSISEALDKTLLDPRARNYFTRFFYPSETNLLREELKREIQQRLENDVWPKWLVIGDDLMYQNQKQHLLKQYDLFINPPKRHKPLFLHKIFLKSRARERRMPIVLYYKAILSELKPDIILLGQKEILHFYSNYPSLEALPIWHELYFSFGTSPESIEARWRIAMYLAGQKKFELADELAAEALTMIETARIDNPQSGQGFEKIFRKPQSTSMDDVAMSKLKFRLMSLRSLIGPENRRNDEQSMNRLAEFVTLNPHSLGYAHKLNSMLESMSKSDPLRDNVSLALALANPDPLVRIKLLTELIEQIKGTDGGIAAQYELAVLKIAVRKDYPQLPQEQRHALLNEAGTALENFIAAYPNSYFVEDAKQKLQSLPKEPAQP